MLVGQDNRASTSKTTAALWTAIVAYFFVAMALVLGFDRTRLGDLIGATSPIYLVFLGGPFASAVIAKALVSDASAAATLQKSQAAAPRVADVFSDDDGNTDLVDLQYLLFNLVVAVIVLVEFLHAPGYGAPAVPAVLAGLTSASAATYVANKALTSPNPPAVARFVPAAVRPGGRVVAVGADFIAPGDVTTPTVLVGGGPAPDDPVSQASPANNPPRADQLAFQVPPTTALGPTAVVLRTPAGIEATSDGLEVVPDALTVSLADPVRVAPGGSFTLYGAGFYSAMDVDASGRPVVRGAQAAVVFLVRRTPGASPVPCAAAGTDGRLTVTVPGDLLGPAGPAWFDLRVQRGGLPVVTPAVPVYVG